MKYYTMPADFKKETIDKYARLNQVYRDSRVKETYGNITAGNELESGRPVDILPEVDLKTLSSYIRYSRERNIDFNYTINASYMENREFTRQGVTAIYDFLSKLYDAGVRSLIVTLPSLIEILSWFPFDFRIKASTICQVTNVNRALELKRMGVERMVADESINREFNVLKAIATAVDETVEIIVNSICYKDCTYRMFHYNQIAGDSLSPAGGTGNNYYPHKCLLRRYETAGNLLKLTWVRPEDIKYYTAVGINHFKLQGRPRVLKGDPVRALEAYFKEDYQGDLMDLLNLFAPVSSFHIPLDNKKLAGFIKHFYENPGFCRHDCHHCGFCESFAAKCIDARTLKKVHGLAKEYYSQLDPVKANVTDLLNSCTQKKKAFAQNTRPVDKEFDF